MFGKCFQLNALSKLSSISKTNADRVSHRVYYMVHKIPLIHQSH